MTGKLISDKYIFRVLQHQKRIKIRKLHLEEGDSKEKPDKAVMVWDCITRIRCRVKREFRQSSCSSYRPGNPHTLWAGLWNVKRALIERSVRSNILLGYVQKALKTVMPDCRSVYYTLIEKLPEEASFDKKQLR